VVVEYNTKDEKRNIKIASVISGHRFNNQQKYSSKPVSGTCLYSDRVPIAAIGLLAPWLGEQKWPLAQYRLF